MTTSELQELLTTLRENGVAEFKHKGIEVKFSMFGPGPHEIPLDAHGNIKKPADHSTLQDMIAEAAKEEDDEETAMWSTQI